MCAMSRLSPTDDHRDDATTFLLQNTPASYQVRQLGDRLAMHAVTRTSCELC